MPKKKKSAAKKLTAKKLLNDINDPAEWEEKILSYEPANEGDEKDLLLAKLIKEREDGVLSRLENQIGGMEFELKKLDLRGEVFKKLLQNSSKANQEEWKYNFSEDYYSDIRHRLAEIKGDIAYEKAWIEQAKKMIKNKKYLNLPSDFFASHHYDYEDVDSCGPAGDPCRDPDRENDITVDDIPF